MNILDLLKNDGILFCKAVSGEYASACPKCGGQDRFRVWPNRGRWWCRSSGKSGDALGYLMTFHNVNYFQACKDLGIEPKKTRARTDKPIKRQAWEPKPAKPPCSIWQNKAVAFI